MHKPSNQTMRIMLLIAFAGLTLGVVLNWSLVYTAVIRITAVFRPVIIAMVIAFFINLPMRVYERWLMKLLHKNKMSHKEALCRALGMILSFLSFAAIISLSASLLYPQLRDSVKMLISNLPKYQENLIAWSQTYVPDLEIDTRIAELYNKIITLFPDLISEFVPRLYTFTTSAASVVADSVIAIVLSFYFLISKDKLVRQLKAVISTYAPRAAKYVLPVCTMLNDKSRRFLGGQLTEAIILGLLCFVGMNILGLPYAPLVSTLVGVTAIIPIFGAFIGVIPSAFIILMDNPLQSLIFVVFIIVLQQIEGNLIYPRVVGDSIGLSGLWVLLAVVIGGGLWGIPGIFVGIPVMSVIYEIVRTDLRRRKKESTAASAQRSAKKT